METQEKKDHQPWKEGDSVMLSNEELVLTGQLREFGKEITEAILKADPQMTFEKLSQMSPKDLFEYIRNLSSI